MLELNVEFQELYKQLDSICRDIFSSKDGVTEYINEMENTEYQFRRYVYGWDEAYKQLKHLRWIRNRLSHEVGSFHCDICTTDDLKALTEFYKSILNRSDPLAIVGHAKREMQEAQPRRYAKNSYSSPYDDSFSPAFDYSAPVITPDFNPDSDSGAAPSKDAKPSLWSRLKGKFKKWFS